MPGRVKTGGGGGGGGGTTYTAGSGIDLTGDVISTTSAQTLAGGRLTLETAVPVSTTDQTAKTTIYYTPYIHDKIGLYDGSAWDQYTFTELSLALGTLTSGLPYDVFMYDNSGTLTLESLAWTSVTARATALVRTNGVWLKTGALTRRYLGTFYTTSTTTTADSQALRGIWNCDNRVNRVLYKTEDDDSWTYNLATVRQANGDATNQVAAVVGLAEEGLNLQLNVDSQCTATVAYILGIGENSTTALKTTNGAHIVQATAPVNFRMSQTAQLRYIPPIGYTYWTWLEWTNANTITFFGAIPGTANTGNDRSGLYGILRM